MSSNGEEREYREERVKTWAEEGRVGREEEVMEAR